MTPTSLDNAVNAAVQLSQRIACNRAGSRSFAGFVLDALRVQEDDSVLDLGPGLGTQLLPVSERARRVVGLDLAPAMVAALRARLTRPHASVVEGDMDALAELDLGGPFTLVYAVYSLHYSRDPARVVQVAAELLQGPGSRLVVVTPDAGNNQTWHDDLATLYELPAAILAVADLPQRVLLPAFRATFATVACATYEDRIRFTSLDELMVYYDACAPYCRADRRAEALEYFRAKFARDGGYEIPKRSLGLVGTR